LGVLVAFFDMDDEVLRYRSALAYNREVFLIEHGAILKAFSHVDQNFMELIEFPQKMRDAQGKSYVSMVPFCCSFSVRAARLLSRSRLSSLPSMGAAEARR
jgi:hypothetical protein